MRDRVLSVRLTEAEYQQLRERAEKAGRSLSDQAREELRPVPPVVPIPGYGGGSVTLPSAGSVIWLNEGGEGGNLTLAA